MYDSRLIRATTFALILLLIPASVVDCRQYNSQGGGTDLLTEFRDLLTASNKIYIIHTSNVPDDFVTKTETVIKQINNSASVTVEKKNTVDAISTLLTKVLSAIIHPSGTQSTQTVIIITTGSFAKMAKSISDRLGGGAWTWGQPNEYHVWIIDMGGTKRGILLIPSNKKGKQVLSKLVQNSKGQNSKSTQQNKPIIGPPPPDTPEERYVAVPVPEPGKYVYDGKEFEATCRGEYCVVLIPKITGMAKMEVHGHEIKKICSHSLPSTSSGTVDLLDTADGKVSIINVGSATIAARELPGNKYKIIEYVAIGYYPVAIEVNIPKRNGAAPEILADVPYLETDPLLRIHLNTDGGNIVVKQIAVGKTASVIEQRISFQACSLQVANVTTSIVEKDGYRVIVSFQILDGDSPVYVPNVRVRIGGKNVVPQYDPTLKVYVASANVVKGQTRIEITTNAEGCNSIGYTNEIYLGESPSDTLKAILGLLAVAAIAAVLLRIAWH